MSEQTSDQQRLRIIFGKVGSQKYVGHLDLAKTWERILRRAELGLSYSLGFNARPKIQLATALPLGVTSECEILDIWLEHPIPIEGLAEKLVSVSPPGLPIHQVIEIPTRAPAVQTLLESSEYVITLPEDMDPEPVRRRVHEMMAQKRIMRTRRDRPYDFRPLLDAMEMDENGQIRAVLALSEGGTGRPDELIDELGLTNSGALVHRVKITLRKG
jgi:radical SAM-linked protein